MTDPDLIRLDAFGEGWGYGFKEGTARAEAEVARLTEALCSVERTLLQSPLVKPYKREQEALGIIRAALAPRAGRHEPGPTGG